VYVLPFTVHCKVAGLTPTVTWAVVVAFVTVRTAVLLVILPTLAVILVVPTATEVARPLLLIVAVAGVPLFQVAEPETSPVLLSE